MVLSFEAAYTTVTERISLTYPEVLNIELRNAIYTEFLHLTPKCADAINLVNSHGQVHDEFAPMYLSPSIRLRLYSPVVPFRQLNNYLHVFFIKRPYESLRTINRNILIRLDKFGTGEERKVDLLQLVQVQKEYPSFSMNFCPGGYRSFFLTSDMMNEIKSAVSVLKNMDARQAERVVSAELEIFMPDEKQREGNMQEAVFVNITAKRRSEKVLWDSRLRSRRQEDVDISITELGFPANYKLLEVRTTWED